MFVRIVRGPGLINAISEITIGLSHRIEGSRSWKNSLGIEVFFVHISEILEAPWRADSSLTCSDSSPMCCLLMQPLITLPVQFLFLFFVFYSFLVLVSPVYWIRSCNWIRGRIKTWMKKDSLKIKGRNGGSSLVLTMFFPLFLKKRLCDPVITPRWVK